MEYSLSMSLANEKIYQQLNSIFTWYLFFFVLSLVSNIRHFHFSHEQLLNVLSDNWLGQLNAAFSSQLDFIISFLFTAWNEPFNSCSGYGGLLYIIFFAFPLYVWTLNCCVCIAQPYNANAGGCWHCWSRQTTRHSEYGYLSSFTKCDPNKFILTNIKLGSA